MAPEDHSNEADAFFEALDAVDESPSVTADKLAERIDQLEAEVSEAKSTANGAALAAFVALTVSAYLWWTLR